MQPYQNQQYPNNNQQQQPPYYAQNPQMQPTQMPNNQYPQQYPQQQYPQQQNMGYNVQQQQYYPQQQHQNLDPKSGGILGNLAPLGAIFIKQKIELCEAFSGCETKNRYYVYPADQNGDRIGGPAFIAKEDSGCCTRICCNDSCRPYQMEFKDYGNGEKTAFNGDRKFRCTFFCCNRPDVKVYLGSEQADYIGKVVDKFSCCSIHLQIFDKNDQLVFRIEGSICQLGIICKQFPCKACQTATFNIFDDKDAAVGVMEKKHNGCCKACFTDSDNFHVRFPTGIPVEQKALLTQAAILLDYQYFEDDTEQQRN